jgi:hypothetical protein
MDEDDVKPKKHVTTASESEVFRELVKNKYDQNLFLIAQEVYHSLQVVLEFMDKGMKGLLTGDLSVYIVQQIHTSIDKFQIQFDENSK